MTDLPSRSQNIVTLDYFEYDDVASRKASGLGYEVALAGRGHRVGSRHEIYFNVEGRKLDPNDWGDKRGWDKEGYEDIEDSKKDRMAKQSYEATEDGLKYDDSISEMSKDIINKAKVHKISSN